MGSLLGPTLANLFLPILEQSWMNERWSPLFYRRYVDDNFVVFDNPDKIDLFHNFLNTSHPNLRVTVEKCHNKISFLDKA